MTFMVEGVLEAVQDSSDEVVVEPLNLGGSSQNEMLFFLKPECFISTSRSQQSAILQIALGLFQQFGMLVAGCVVQSGQRLADLRIMDKHYGFINRVSRSASEISSSDRARIDEYIGEANRPILGAHEFLDRFREYTPKSLDKLWSSKRSVKIRSGLYFESYEINGHSFVLLNGFHPAQLEHFTQPDRRVALMVLQSDLPWRILRSYMLGDTFPERAVSGSFRRTLFDSPRTFGLSSVSIANNAAHLSAGPFEAMFEMSNFLGRGRASFEISSCKMWNILSSLGLDRHEIERSMTNPIGRVGPTDRLLFEITEEIDAQGAGNLCASHFFDKNQRHPIEGDQIPH